MSADRYEIQINQGGRLEISIGGSVVSVSTPESHTFRAIRQQARDIEQLRTDLAAAVAERNELRSYRTEWEPVWDDIEDALIGEQQRDSYGLGESIADCARRVIRERDQARWTLRGIAQQLIEQIGAAGPEDAIDAARRACGVIESMTTRLAAIDGAPTVAKRHSRFIGGIALLDRDLPNDTELIARPTKD